MNERTFLKKVADDDITRTRLEAEVASILARYARSEGITLDEMSDTEIHELATGIVSRGLQE